jgi:Holliday junction resolvase RusA-like endonuclease
MTAEGKALKEQYQWEAKAQWKGKPLEGDIEVSITLYFGTKRRADLDNFNKLSLDALTCIVYVDDAQIAELHLKWAYVRGAQGWKLPLSKINAVSGTGQSVRC